MRIIPELHKVPEVYEISLHLRAESSAMEELSRVSESLLHMNLPFSAKPLKKQEDMLRIVFEIHGRKDIALFLDKLHIELRGFKDKTTVVGIGQGKHPYRCEQLTRFDRIKDCIDMHADDDFTAFVLCGILAGNRNWTGGKAHKGYCRL